MKHTRKVSSAAAQAMAANDITVAFESNNAGLLKSLDICIPVCVYSYDREKHKVTVLPLVKQAYYNKKWNFVSRQPFEVSIRNVQCGGFSMDFPVFVGDTGWVFSSDRDTFFLKDEDSPTHLVLGKDRDIEVVEDVLPQPAKQPKIHSLLDGFFLPDNWGKWEFQRFKDSDDINLKNAFYLGTSFYDEDEESSKSKKDKDDDDKEEDESDADDETYEGNASSSIVLTRSGSLYLLGSSKESTKKKAKLKLNRNGIDLELENESNDKKKIWKKVSMVFSTEKGIDIDCKGDVLANTFKLDSNGIEMKFKSEKSRDSNRKEAILTISPKLDVNIVAPGDIKLSAGAITTECKNISVIGEKTTFNIDTLNGLASDVTINSSKDISLRSMGSISLSSASSINVGTAGSVAIGSVGGDVSIEGGKMKMKASEIFMSAGGASLQMSSSGVSLVGSNTSISGDTFSLNTNIGISNGQQFISGGTLVLT